MSLRPWEKVDAWLAKVDQVLTEHESQLGQVKRLLPTSLWPSPKP